MTRLVANALAWLAVLAVLAVSGGYTLHYLLSWQWARAEIAGIAFVAATVLASTLLIVRRLRRIEYRLALLAAPVPAAAVAPPAQVPAAGGTPVVGGPAPVEPRPDFPWLAPQLGLVPALPLLVEAPGVSGRAVFIPVFLATGLVVSLVASAVERLSALRHGEPLPAGTAHPPPSLAVLRDRPARGLLLVPLVGAVLVVALILGLYRASHYRSEPIGNGITTMTVQVAHKGAPVDEVATVETLARYCAANAGIGVSYRGVRPGADGTVLLRISPLLDDDARSRYSGCLSDALLQQVQLHVSDTALRPGPER
ncbi:hypothetical protein [Nocardioides mesophilus]|uniref:Uncharacterized protein n=1 Tax=Nocardioides mesophilus TaxID=433659 RepID=A0A7G9RD10_9ACTN|nr:hypothetical protein [Nocardioides mesophilus]QNN53485.1 hypothetical protein H9L09_03310 [Nocardioides mesophilus]